MLLCCFLTPPCVPGASQICECVCILLNEAIALLHSECHPDDKPNMVMTILGMTDVIHL